MNGTSNRSSSLHGVGVSEPLDDLSHSGPLLADGDVDAEKLLLGVGAVVEVLDVKISGRILSNNPFKKYRKIKIHVQ